MSDPSEKPEVPAGEAPPNEPAAAETATAQNDPDAVESNSDGEKTTTARQTRSPWLWLLAGAMAAILVPIAVERVLGIPIEMTEEQQSINEQAAPSEEDSLRLGEIEMEQAESRLRSTLINAGIVMGVIFGLFAGLIHRRLVMGVVGAVVGVGVAFALPPFVTETILEFEADALLDQDDIMAMVVHSLQWMVIGVAAAAAILVGSLRISKGAKALGLMILSAILGGVIYVVAGTALDPENTIILAAPVSGVSRYLWTSLPPVLAGLFLART